MPMEKSCHDRILVTDFGTHTPSLDSVFAKPFTTSSFRLEEKENLPPFWKNVNQSVDANKQKIPFQVFFSRFEGEIGLSTCAHHEKFMRQTGRKILFGYDDSRKENSDLTN
jgi:hypothetical protein